MAEKENEGGIILQSEATCYTGSRHCDCDDVLVGRVWMMKIELPRAISGRARMPGKRHGVMPVIVFITVLFAFTVASCDQSSPAVTEQVPTIQPTRPTLIPELPAKLPVESLLPPAVDVELVGSSDELASTQHPAYLLAEVTGRQLSNVSLISGSVMEDGRRRVLIHHPIDPDPDDGTWPGVWANGVTDLVQTWDLTGDYLWDGQRGDFVVLWVTDPATSTRTVHGRYRAEGTDTYVEAVLVVNIPDGMAQNVIITTTGEATTLVAGDEFQPTQLILDDGGTMHSEPGTSLSFGEGGHLAYARRPVPSGSYFMGVSAESAGGEADAGYSRFEVNNDALISGYQAVLDPERGYQLLYPETWPLPSEEGNRLLFMDPTNDIQMSISSHPDMSDQPIVDLKQRALGAYGDVSVLYEDQVEIGQSGGLRTVYGYQALEGPRTGILLTFSQSGQSYLVDIDGPANREAAMLNLAGVVAGSWASRSVVATGDGRWVQASIDGLEVKAPADHRPQQMSNGWQRFASADELTFLAMRSEPAAERALYGGLDHWLGVAGGNVYDFAASEIYAHERGARSWARVDFEYTLDTGERVAGAIMVTRIADRFLILWAESPLESFPQYEEQVLLTVVDDLSGDIQEVRGGDIAP